MTSKDAPISDLALAVYARYRAEGGSMLGLGTVANFARYAEDSIASDPSLAPPSVVAAIRAEAEAERDELRAEVERLARERTDARMEVENAMSHIDRGMVYVEGGDFVDIRNDARAERPDYGAASAAEIAELLAENERLRSARVGSPWAPTIESQS